MSFPDELSQLLKPMTAMASETFASVSTPIQYAAISAFLGGPIIDDYLFHVRRILKIIGESCFNILNGNDVNVVSPQGGFYLFPVFNKINKGITDFEIKSSNDFCNILGTCSSVDFKFESSIFLIPRKILEMNSA